MEVNIWEGNENACNGVDKRNAITSGKRDWRSNWRRRMGLEVENVMGKDYNVNVKGGKKKRKGGEKRKRKTRFRKYTEMRSSDLSFGQGSSFFGN